MKSKLLIVTFILALMLNGVYASGKNIWAIINDAATYESDGQLASALPLWIEIVEYFEKEEDYTNTAVFSKKIGKYYDENKEYQKAVFYYEKENENWEKIDSPWGAEDMLRVEEIKTTFEIYVEVKADTIRKLEKYEPVSGIYAGIYSENDPAVGQKFSLTKSVYGSHAQYVLYQSWGLMINGEHYIDVVLAERMKKENAGFHIALNPMNGLEVLTEDRWIVSWAKEAKSLDMPIFLRFACEMNGDWTKWDGNPELYIEKFRMVHDIMEKYAPNVVMVWTPNDSPIEMNGIRLEDYYPGDNYVDWVGVNFYIDYYDSGNVNEDNNFLQNPLSHLDYVYDLYAYKKPIMISETAVSHYSIPNKKDLTNWGVENLKKLYAQLPIKYPRVKAINYFSLNQNNKNYVVGNRWNNYAISENLKFKNTYKSLITSKYYLGSMDDSIDTTFVPVDESADLSLYEELFFIIKIVDYKIEKVEFYDGNNLINTDKELPYSLKSDLTKINNLIVKAYDSNGNLSLTKEIYAKKLIKEEKVKEKEIKEDIVVAKEKLKVTQTSHT